MDALHRAFIAHVRQRMKERGLSLNRLADFAGLGRGTMSDLLAGKMSPSLRTVAKIADALETTAHDLLRE